MIKKKEAIMKFLHYRILSRRGDSNARPPRPERGALPTALLLGGGRENKMTSLTSGYNHLGF